MVRLSLDAVNRVYDVDAAPITVRLPAPFDRWVQQGGIADRLVRKLSLVSLMILLLWLLRML